MLVIDPGALPQPRRHTHPPTRSRHETKPPRWVQIIAAVLRRYLALDMAVYAGSATLFLLTASFPLLMWVLMLVNLVPGFSVEGVAELLADFLPQIPEIQTAILGLLQI